MAFRRGALLTTSALSALVIVAGCTGGSDGNSTSSATTTVTATDTVSPSTSSGGSPTGSGASSGASAPTSGGSTGSGGNASGPGLCTPTVMTFRLGQGDGAAGTSYVPIVATNASRQPCVTTGYPGVAALNAAGKQIAQATRTSGGVPVTTIVVQPGQQISAQLGGAAMGEGGVTCPQSPAVLFTLPDNTDSTRIVAGIPACTDGLRIGPFVRGVTGQQ